ncbi:MAG: glycosyltransferase family 39 protein, partial [bacterium]
MKKALQLIEKYGIALILVLAGYLNIFKLWSLGYGNEYYAATVKSMLSSFSNFFFVSFDSTGFISVDKAPLSLWVDALFAKVFGFSGFTILLPHALEGMLVTLLVYLIVKKVCGVWPALLASLVVTLSPVNVAVYRNNTPDALLLVFILLTVWFFIRYFETHKVQFLLLSAVMLGLGFNTKMLQAFLILPALLVAIVVFAPGKLLQRVKPLLLFTVLLVVVSFSWITIVDLTPASARPYVGSSGTNSAWNLALGYNGIQRLEGETGIGGNPGFNVGDKGVLRLFTGEMGTQSGWFLLSALLFSLCFLWLYRKSFFKSFRFNEGESSLYVVLMLVAFVYLITTSVFFSMASFFHSYYLNILAVPIALLMAGLLYEIIQTQTHKHIAYDSDAAAKISASRMALKNKLLWGILAVSALIQGWLIYQAGYAVFLIPLVIVLAIGALLILVLLKNSKVIFAAGVILFVSLLITPFVWSTYTTVQGNTATPIFIGGPSVRNARSNDLHGGPGGGFPGGMPGNVADGRNGEGRNRQRDVANTFQDGGAQGFPPFDGGQGGGPFDDGRQGGGGAFGMQAVNADLLAYLKEHYNNEKYFVAVSSASEAEGFILSENIGNIMNMGGFSGRDQAITLSALQENIKNGLNRFFYFWGRGDRGGNMPFGAFYDDPFADGGGG